MALLSTVRGAIAVGAPLLCFASILHAEPLSKKTEIDFFRDVPSRNLKGLAARSDGRLVAGPTFTELKGEAPADLLWCVQPTNDPAKWLIGSGPDGKIYEVTIDAAASSFTSHEVAKLDESHIFALLRLPDGALLAGTSPHGALCLVRNGKQTSRVALPVDSIFDLLLVDSHTALAATGNPGRIYRIDLAKFAASSVVAEKITDTKILAEHGITVFGEIRDRNVRRLARFADGRIVAGSAPKGNIYTFEADGGKPSILQENRDAEVTDLLTEPNGDLYATVTFSGSTGDTRITPTGKNNKDTGEVLFQPSLSSGTERFSGRAAAIWFPANGFPETLTSRGSMAFYRVLRYQDTLLLAGGEQGELLGFDLKERMSLTFAGSPSSQINGLAAVAGSSGRFLALHNNAPGLSWIDFSGKSGREAETHRIDLGAPSLLGNLRFGRVRNLADNQISIEAKTSNGSDEVEGWSPWSPLKVDDSGWHAANNAMRGRFVKLRVSLPAASPAGTQLDKAALYSLPQNRRPLLQDFRLLSPNFGIIPPPDTPASGATTLGQLMQGGHDKDDDKRKLGILGSQVVPVPGSQVVFWTVTDPDGDNLRCTFSLRREDEASWTDVAVDTRDSYVQFDISHLSDGVYFTRLVVTETDPRPPADRLSATFETDDLIVDHSPPAILDATAKRDRDNIVVTVHGRDALSLLDGIDATFNNGDHEQTEQPADGIRDGREETFVLEIPLARAAGATSVEVTLYDASGNTATKRLTW